MRKRITILGLLILWLGGCWIVGQRRNLKKFSENTQESIQENESENIFSNYSSSFDSIYFEGNKETTDNPWNMTAGEFEMEGEGNCILLTPNTAVGFYKKEDFTSFSFYCEIHPWVREGSDGAGLLIWLMDDQDAILYQEEIIIDSEEDWKGVELDFSLYSGVKEIKLLCNNGGNGDDSGDWVVVKVLKTEESLNLSGK